MTIRRATVALLAFALTACTWLMAIPAQADDTYPVRIDVASVSTDTIALGSPGEVQISGTITNVSDRSLTWVTVEFWRSQAVITTPEQLTDAVAAEPHSPSGARLNNPEAGNMVVVSRTEPFKPGQIAPFTIKADVSALGFTVEGAYRIGVHVRALDTDGLVKSVGINRWLIPVVSSKHQHAALSVLSSAPSMTTSATFTDNHLADELSGRLEELLKLAERPGAQFVLDPALYDEVKALTEQHTVGGSVRAAVSAAGPWLARLDVLIAARSGYRLPYGNPDLLAASEANALPGTLDRAALSLASSHPTAKLDQAVVGGSPDVASALGSHTIVFSSNALGSTPTLVGTTAFPTRTLSPTPPTAMHLHGQKLSEELVGSLSGHQVVRLISTQDDITAENCAAAWRTLAHASLTGAATWSGRPSATADARYAQIAAWSDRIDLYRSITDTTSMITAATQVSLKAQSPLFSAAESLAYLNAAASLQLPATPVQLRAQPNVVLSGRESQFPISITNTSHVPVTVRVKFESTIPQRIFVADSDLVTVAAGETVGLVATATATTNGIVQVAAHLASASERRVGPNQMIEITSTEAGRVGWVIILASAMLFTGGTVWRVRAVQRERARTATEETE